MLATYLFPLARLRGMQNVSQLTSIEAPFLDQALAWWASSSLAVEICVALLFCPGSAGGTTGDVSSWRTWFAQRSPAS
ncbi:hypothetical protein CHR55_15210 [Rhodococcus qingshengii]|uniref:Uncharacterized protein n=1 Tax=Rhodococcus qingshengii TaxID=334542 RepID=A0A2A5JAU1_RHOSG|nr:hypothetical protein CHR55_15210 [Rhodococcus qingshengii]